METTFFLVTVVYVPFVVSFVVRVSNSFFRKGVLEMPIAANEEWHSCVSRRVPSASKKHVSRDMTAT